MKTPVYVQLGYYMNDPDGTVSLDVSDRKTGMRLVQVRLNAADFRNMMSSQAIRAEADIPHPDVYGIVGREMTVDIVQVKSASFGREVPPEVVAEKRRQRVKAKKEGREVDVEARQTNHGWEVLVRTYLPRTGTEGT